MGSEMCIRDRFLGYFICAVLGDGDIVEEFEFVVPIVPEPVERQVSRLVGLVPIIKVLVEVEILAPHLTGAKRDRLLRHFEEMVDAFH